MNGRLVYNLSSVVQAPTTDLQLLIVVSCISGHWTDCILHCALCLLVVCRTSGHSQSAAAAPPANSFNLSISAHVSSVFSRPTHCLGLVWKSVKKVTKNWNALKRWLMLGGNAVAVVICSSLTYKRSVYCSKLLILYFCTFRSLLDSGALGSRRPRQPSPF